MAKKDRKRNKLNNIKDFDLYLETSIEYFGVIKKNGRIKIDTKRLVKVTSELNMMSLHDVAVKASQVPRNTAYFYPSFPNRTDYIINKFRDEFKKLWSDWKTIQEAINNLPKPEEKISNMRLNLISGIIDSDDICEVDSKCNIALAMAKSNYHIIKLNLIVQFIHQIATRLDALLIRICRDLGMKVKDDKYLNKREVIMFLQGYVKGKYTIEDIDNYQNSYNKFNKVWNLLKHNSMNLFNKVKENYPDMIINENYQNGELSQYYLKIDEEYVEKMLVDLEKFYESLCNKMFNEDIEESKWNYDEYFINEIKFHNPLDYDF